MLSRLFGFWLIVLVFHAGPVRAQTMAEVQEMAQHLQMITQVSQQMLSIMDASTQLDNLAYAVAEGSITPQQARANAADIYRNLSAHHDQASRSLEQLGPSRFKGQPEIYGRVDAYFASAKTMQAMALDFLDNGMALVETAAEGDEDVFALVELRSLESALQNLQFQNSALENQRSYEEPGSWNFEYSTAVLHQNAMMIAFLEESIETLDTGGPLNYQRLMQTVNDHYRQARNALENSRRNAARSYNQVRGQPGTSPSIEALLDYLFNDNIPRTLDVEDRLTYEMLALEEERLRLTSERQRAISGG